MILRTLKGTARLQLTLALALCGLFALVSSAAAVVYVYKNGFNSLAAYNEVDQISGGNNCDSSYSSGSKAMRIEMRGRTFCEYSPPVTGDADQPDHEIVAEGRILPSTPDNVKKQSYLGVRVRVGEGTYYEFRVTPKEKAYRLNRVPSGGGAGLPVTGNANAIKPVGEKNKLRLRITGNDVTAFVNGNPVATYNDPNPGQVTGRKVSLGIGSTKKTNPGPIGVFTALKVGVPNP